MNVKYNLEFTELTRAKDNVICLAYEIFTGSLYNLTRTSYGNKIFEVGLEASPYKGALKIYELNAVLPKPQIDDTNSWWIGNNKIMHFTDINSAIFYWNRNKYIKLPKTFIKDFLEELYLQSFNDSPTNYLKLITSINIDYQFTNNNCFEPKLINKEPIISF